MSVMSKPDKYYVGVVSRGTGEDSHNLGFATPMDGPQSAFLKRKSTVDNWVRQNADYIRRNRDPEYQPTFLEIDNVPVDGFCISHNVRRSNSWNSGNVVWRVMDPRGFELEIPSGNLMNIMNSVGIGQQGVITKRCVWARIGSDNILIPEDSSEYQALLAEDALRRTKAIKPSQIVPGSSVILANKSDGVYFGNVRLLVSANVTPLYPEETGRLSSYVSSIDTWSALELHANKGGILQTSKAYGVSLVNQQFPLLDARASGNVKYVVSVPGSAITPQEMVDRLSISELKYSQVQLSVPGQKLDFEEGSLRLYCCEYLGAIPKNIPYANVTTSIQLVELTEDEVFGMVEDSPAVRSFVHASMPMYSAISRVNQRRDGEWSETIDLLLPRGVHASLRVNIPGLNLLTPLAALHGNPSIYANPVELTGISSAALQDDKINVRDGLLFRNERLFLTHRPQIGLRSAFTPTNLDRYDVSTKELTPQEKKEIVVNTMRVAQLYKIAVNCYADQNLLFTTYLR